MFTYQNLNENMEKTHNSNYIEDLTSYSNESKNAYVNYLKTVSSHIEKLTNDKVSYKVMDNGYVMMFYNSNTDKEIIQEIINQQNLTQFIVSEKNNVNAIYFK